MKQISNKENKLPSKKWKKFIEVEYCLSNSVQA